MNRNRSFFKKRFIYLLCIQCSACMYPAGQKRATDLIADGCEPLCGFWELNSGPRKKLLRGKVKAILGCFIHFIGELIVPSLLVTSGVWASYSLACSFSP
jgi:hypothetical protein